MLLFSLADSRSLALPTLSFLLRYVGSLITFDLFEFTAADCAIPSFYVRWLLTVCVPLLFLSPLLIMVFFHSPLLYGKVESAAQLKAAKTNKRGDELFQTLAIIIVFLYALMVGKSISPFECTLGPDNRWYLREDVSIRCWEDDQWHMMACIVGIVRGRAAAAPRRLLCCTSTWRNQRPSVASGS